MDYLTDRPVRQAERNILQKLHNTYLYCIISNAQIQNILKIYIGGDVACADPAVALRSNCRWHILPCPQRDDRHHAVERHQCVSPHHQLTPPGVVRNLRWGEIVRSPDHRWTIRRTPPTDRSIRQARIDKLTKLCNAYMYCIMRVSIPTGAQFSKKTKKRYLRQRRCPVQIPQWPEGLTAAGTFYPARHIAGRHRAALVTHCLWVPVSPNCQPTYLQAPLTTTCGQEPALGRDSPAPRP